MAGIRVEDIAKSILSGETDDKILSQLAQSRRQQKVFKLEIRFNPHEMQRAFLESPSRFRIVCAGRRGGKTMGCVADEVRFAWEHPKSRCFWVAPVYQQTMRAFRMMVDFLPPKVITRIERTDRRLWLVNEAMIEFRSATDYENLRGEGIDFLVIDEAAYVAREAWEASLRPALADRMGRAVIISTPRGRGWFYELWQRGAARNDLFMASFRFPTSANPYIPREEIEQARETLPADVFQQEFEACFLEESAGVFRGIDKCIKGEIEYPSPDGNYVIGLDLARTTDYTVAVVMETGRKHVVYMDRFTKCDWQTQIERVAALSRRYNNALILMDSTGVGDPILSEIDARGLEVEGYTFTNQSKRALIEGLVLAIEKGGITYPHMEALISELRVYEYEISTTSNAVHYSAPSGFNDDCVIALALATYQSDNTWVRERVKR